MAYAKSYGYKATEELDKLKANVKLAHDYFQDNYKTYRYFKSFALRSNLRAEDVQVLADIQKPQVETNILDAMGSRLLGEFTQLEPSVIIRSLGGAVVTPDLLATMEVFGYHLRSMLKPNKNDNLFYNLYRDLLYGGWGVMELDVDYENDMSMKKVIRPLYVPDPTLTYWDPMARLSHKGDGMFCGKLIPKSKQDMELEYGSDAVKNIKFTRDLAGFSWSYRTQEDEVLLVAEHWQKKFKSMRITELSDGSTIPVKDYEEFAERWRQSDIPRAVPVPVGKARTTKVPTICRSLFTENSILDYRETSYKYFNLIFFDGNSALLTDNAGTNTTQMTRPWIMNCRDAQKVLNFAVQSMAGEVENMIQHKYLAAIESVPEDYLDAYRNPQRATTLMYNAFMDDDPDRPLPAPQVIPRPGLPTELIQIYESMQKTIQMITGSYDAQLGIQNNQLSGVAIQNGAMQASAAALPYNVGMMNGLNRVCQIMLDLIPKVYVTPRSIPVKLPDGKYDYVMINVPKGPNTLFNPDNFEIEVEAAANFEVQKQVSFTTLINLVKALPQSMLAAYLQGPAGSIFLDNIDIRNIEGLKSGFDKFAKQQQQQQANQPNPAEIQAQIQQQQLAVQQAQVQQRDEASKRDFMATVIKTAAQTSVAKQANDIQFMSVADKIDQGAAKKELEQEKIDAETARTAVDMAVGVSAHELEVAKHLHNVSNQNENQDG